MKITIEGERGCGCTTVATMIERMLQRLGAGTVFVGDGLMSDRERDEFVLDAENLRHLNVEIYDKGCIGEPIEYKSSKKQREFAKQSNRVRARRIALGALTFRQQSK